MFNKINYLLKTGPDMSKAILCQNVIFQYLPSFLAMQIITIFTSFFLNDPATPEIYPLPLHAALPIYPLADYERGDPAFGVEGRPRAQRQAVFSSRLHDFPLRIRLASSHDVYNLEFLSGLHHERLYVVDAWHFVSPA